MKKIIWAIYCLLIVMQGAGAASTNITVKVVDETGLPLQDVKTTIVFDAQDERKKIEGLTDTNGLFSAQGEIPAKIGIDGEKDGYYRSVDNFYFIPGKDIEELEPWGGFPLTLRSIIDPKEGKKAGFNGSIPKMDEALGFDVVVGDWVVPYGKGVASDFVFTCSNDPTNKVAFYVLTFPNDGDGIIEFPRDKEGQSIFWWPHKAPLDGYLKELKKKKNYSGRYGGDPVLPEYTELSSETYEILQIFRVRTQYDKEGNIITAYYGKMLGESKISGNNRLGLGYWLNTDPHSRSLESMDPDSP